MMKRVILTLIASSLLVFDVYGQQSYADRLPADVLDVTPPSAMVLGAPGEMRIDSPRCRTLPTSETRSRIVDVAVQEWGFFGFSIVDETRIETDGDGGARRVGGTRPRRGRSRLSAEESARVAGSIAGYWAVTPDGSWIIDRQNDAWNGPRGVSSRWRDPWSAAFISWVMCAGGLGSREQFRRAIAHHTYIDQAIRSRDGNAPGAAFTAHDIGEEPIEPGDLLCSARRPGYRTIAERRRQMGVGARTHCDVVVKVDPANERILAIGGNVRGTVSMKLLPAVFEGDALRPVPGRRAMFAHLKLGADSIGLDALDRSPTIQTIGCVPLEESPTPLAASAGAGSRIPNLRSAPTDRC